jgi:hypothetical protein
MGFDTQFLRSKIARRIFYIFICCSLFPIAALSFKSHSQVSRELEEQSRKRVCHWSKNVAMSILERLAFLEREMEITALSLRTTRIPIVAAKRELAEDEASRRFTAMFLLKESGASMPLFGFEEEPPPLSTEEMHKVRSGRIMVVPRFQPDVPPRVFMVRQVDEGNPEFGLLVGEINTDCLWDIGVQVNLPPMTELCVIDESVRVLASIALKSRAGTSSRRWRIPSMSCPLS